MFCPNCGRDCGEFKFCPDCGTQVNFLESNNTEQKKKLIFPEPPIGRYKYTNGYLEIGQDSLTICSKPFFKERRRKSIPFNEIAAVSFSDGRLSTGGFLCIRDKWNRGVPMVTAANMAVLDRSSVYFPRSSGTDFYPVYEFLRKCAVLNNAAEKNRTTW